MLSLGPGAGFGGLAPFYQKVQMQSDRVQFAVSSTFVFKTQGFSKSDPFLIATVEAGVGGHLKSK